MKGNRLTAAAALAVLAFLGTGAAAPACTLPDSAPRLSTFKPIDGSDVRLATSFGMRRDPIVGTVGLHAGVDWAALRGAPVTAAAAGRISFTGLRSGYGRTVVIDHGGGLQTLYGHLADVGVKVGECVADRSRIGGAGSSGLASATGVHFEVRRGGNAVDPMREPTATKD